MVDELTMSAGKTLSAIVATISVGRCVDRGMVGSGACELEAVEATVLLRVEDVKLVSTSDRMRGWRVERSD